MDMAVKELVKVLKKNSFPVKGKDDIKEFLLLATVASISSGNDEFVGNLIAETIEKIGSDGISSALLENGGMCMHDEAVTHYIDMIDQTTFGHRFIKKDFGVTPRIGWQIDPFGHSAVKAYLLGAEGGRQEYGESLQRGCLRLWAAELGVIEFVAERFKEENHQENSFEATMKGEIEDNGAIQIPPTRVAHIKKRVLKNKGVSVSFSEKDLKDYVTGFHKRKKKRRKEAIKQQEEKLRLKRIAGRKQRKLEKEFALYGGAPPATDQSNVYEEYDEESEPIASINGTTKYDNGEMQVTVTTCEISQQDEDGPSEKTQADVPRLIEADKTHKLSVSKKKSFKKVSKHKSRSKPQNKRDRKKGKTKNNKR
ncbi:unnamed protein product [Dovyalis caffra]|uniref:Glycoside hydrolase family 38 N-terminal domain-containing protein n=1 Tax=Dovyalis caffra TaxID=77055 RepID=A0AAV1SHX9_9ROSI|nr:unnamed protein product [Dovyalis caffra]